MPTSSKPRRAYRGSRSGRDLASGRLTAPAPSASHSEHHETPPSKPNIGRATPMGSGAVPPHQSPPPGPSPAGLSGAPSRLRGKRGILIAAGAATAGAGGLVYDRKRRRAQVSKIYNPITDETVEFGKALPHRGKLGLAVGGGAMYGFDRASGGHNQRVGYRRHSGTKAGQMQSHAFYGADDAGDQAALSRYGRQLDRGAASQAHRYANERADRRAGVGKALIPASPATGTNVRSVTPILPGGPHVSHENDLYTHGRRKVTPHGDTQVRRYRGKGSKPAEGGQPIRKSLATQQGAATRGTRGTPMSGIAQAGRVGHRLAIS